MLGSHRAPAAGTVQQIVESGLLPEVLEQVQRFLMLRQQSEPPTPELERAWEAFYLLCTQRIRKYAFACGAREETVGDCTQEVWAELLRRLRTFQLDQERGRFETWLYCIVRGKTANVCRPRRKAMNQNQDCELQNIEAGGRRPELAFEDEEWFSLIWRRLRHGLSACNLRVLQLRLVEGRSVAEVAQELGLSSEQVWYRYHRARRELRAMGSSWIEADGGPRGLFEPQQEKRKKAEKSAQVDPVSPVSRDVGPDFLGCQRANCVDYVFQKLELGRRELTPEWKIKWTCEGTPRPVLCIRKSAMVAYAEICGPGEVANASWPRIVQAAIAAGVAAGIATIVATPSAALPVFRTEFQKHLQGKGCQTLDDGIQVALSAKREPSGPWFECKN